MTGVTIILANQFQNGALARYPNATVELAIFAYAFSTFSVFRAALVFVPQMSNLLGRSRRAQRTLVGFIILIGVGLTAPLLFLGYSSLGAAWIGRIFGIDGEILSAVLSYVRLLAPLVPIVAFRQYFMGLLIQMRSTRLVTVLNLLHLATLFAVLFLGYRSSWSAVETLVTAQWSAAIVHLAILGAAVRWTYQLPELEHPELTYSQTLAFFWPVAVTSMMFAMSRPILYALVSLRTDALVAVASLRIAFDLAIFFHQPLNQFRNLFATFGTRDLAGLRRFQIEVVVVLTAAMVIVSWTRLDTLVLTRLLGIEGPVLRYAEEAFRILCALPIVVGARNYFHGIALARLATNGMAVGALFRVFAISVCAGTAAYFGGLDHRVAASILVLGFAAEAVVVVTFLERSDRPLAAEESAARS